MGTEDRWETWGRILETLDIMISSVALNHYVDGYLLKIVEQEYNLIRTVTQ